MLEKNRIQSGFFCYFFFLSRLEKFASFFYFMRGFFFSRFSISAKKKRKIFNILQSARPIINLPAVRNLSFLFVIEKVVGRLTRLNKKFLAEKVVKILFAPLLKKGKKKTPKLSRLGTLRRRIKSNYFTIFTGPNSPDSDSFSSEANPE